MSVPTSDSGLLRSVEDVVARFRAQAVSVKRTNALILDHLWRRCRKVCVFSYAKSSEFPPLGLMYAKDGECYVC